MTTVRVAQRDRWTAIDRRTLNDTQLSFRARGVLAWLLDKPDDWTTTAAAIADAGAEGRDAIRSALNELEQAGYLERRRWRQGDGTWGSEWVVRERPRRDSSTGADQGERDETAGHDQGGKPAPENQHRETSPPNETETETETERLKDDANLGAVASLPRSLTFTPSGPAVEGGRLGEAVQLCAVMARQLRGRGHRVPDARPLSKGWVEPMEALLRIDERPVDQVVKVLAWLDAGRDRTANFWRTNVLTPDKLRLRWDAMSEQYARERGPRPGAASHLHDGTSLADVLPIRREALDA